MAGTRSTQLRRVAHLSSVHPLGDPRIYQKECRSLYEAGFDVFMVGIGESSAPPAAPRMIGIRPSSSRLLRFVRSTCAVVWIGLRQRAQVFHLHDVELIPFGLLLKLMGKRVIFDNHEYLIEDILDKGYIPRPLRRIAAAATALTLRLADRFFDGIVVAAPAMIQRFRNPQTVVINNYAEWVVPRGHDVPFERREAAIAYMGGIDESRGIREIVQAMEIANIRMKVKLILAGAISPPGLHHELQNSPGWRYVDFRGIVPRSEVKGLLDSALAGLVIFHNIGNHRNASPNKLFEYMAAGLPVIMPDFPSWVERFGSTGACLPVDPHDAGAIAERICWIVENRREAQEMGLRGLEAARTSFHWNSERDKLLALYGRITAAGAESSVPAKPVTEQVVERNVR